MLRASIVVRPGQSASTGFATGSETVSTLLMGWID
jgi:hypothetical protein